MRNTKDDSEWFFCRQTLWEKQHDRDECDTSWFILFWMIDHLFVGRLWKRSIEMGVQYDQYVQYAGANRQWCFSVAWLITFAVFDVCEVSLTSFTPCLAFMYQWAVMLIGTVQQLKERKVAGSMSETFLGWELGRCAGFPHPEHGGGQGGQKITGSAASMVENRGGLRSI